MADQDVGTDPHASPDKPQPEPRQAVAGEVSDYAPEDDPDYQALVQARKEAEGDEAGQEEGQPGGAPAEPPPAQPASASGDDSPAGAQPAGADQPETGKKPADEPEPSAQMIPKARLDEVLHHYRQLEGQFNYLRGAFEAMRQQGVAAQGRPAQGQPGQDQPPPPPKPEDRIQQARSRKAEAAEKYDAGDLSMADYERIRDQADDEIWQARQDAYQQAQPAREPAAPSQPATTMADEHLLEQQLNHLVQRHPYVEAMTDAEMQRLRAMAYADAAAAGDPITSDTRGTYRLRERVAELSDYMGPVWHPEFRPPAGQGAQPNGQPAQPQAQPGQGQPVRSPQAQQRADKLHMAEGMPPDPNDMGAGAGSEGQMPSETQIQQMTDDEIQALPPATRQRFLGITP